MLNYCHVVSGAVIVPRSQAFTVPGREGETGIRVSLALPPRPTDSPVPVVLLLDGDFMFLAATEFARTVNLVTMGDFPPLAVVGLMRDEPDPLRYVASRFRDFTPSRWTIPGPFSEDNALTFMGTGGADQFLQAIVGGVLPEVIARLAKDGFAPGEMAIGGWSLSGLFACWAWTERPDVFTHLLAISPSLWWDDASILARPPGGCTENQRVSVSVGEHEEGDASLVYPRRFAHAEQRELAAMVRNAEQFARMVREAGAEVDHTVMVDEHHVTVQTAALARGLRFIFG